MKYIKKGILTKGDLPRKEDCNFSSLPAIELIKNSLKTYLETLSNQPATKINGEHPHHNRQTANLSEGTNLQAAYLGVNFLPRELLEFLNFETKLIDEIMDYQEQKLLPSQNNMAYAMTDSVLYGGEINNVLIKRTDN